MKKCTVIGMLRDRRIAAWFLATSFAILLPAAADTFTWTGGGANKKWSTAANWDPAGPLTDADTANFQTGTLASDTITYDSGTFAGITAQSGTWTVNVSSACFTNRPITIASGAKFALSGASTRVNPFSTNKNANAVAGLLDLGGAKQTITDAMSGSDTGFFRNGGEIRNGTLKVDYGSLVTANLKNTTFTIGEGACVTGVVRVYLTDGANVIIDGGAFRSPSTSPSNHPIGSNSSQSHLTVRNGGLFAVAKEVWVAHKGTGYMIGDGGTYDLGSSTLYVGINKDSTAILALTNSTLTCGTFSFGYNASLPSRQSVVIKDSIATITRFLGTKLASTASLLFDGATLVPKAARTDFLPNSAALPTPTLGAGGLIISNNYDITIAKGLSGAGRLVKAGSSTLTLSSTNTFTGGIEVRKGTLALPSGAVFANSTLAMADGTTLKLKYSPDYAFATTNLALALDANTSGKITVDIDLSAGMPPVGTYTLFAPGLNAADLNRITFIPEDSFNVAFAQNGALTITLERTPVTHVWTGGGADAKWTTTANWDVDNDFGPLDKVVFSGTDGYSVFDCADGLRLWDITVNSGCHTANVANASFANTPLVVASGSSFVLENADGVINPFSTLANTNTLAGLLDLGGATQTITTPLDGNNTGFFRNGCEIRNGTLTVIPQTPSGNIRFKDSTITVGPGANISGVIRVDLNNGHFVIDGGTLTSTYADRDIGNHPIGRTAASSIVLRNGGRFVSASELWIGFNANGTVVGNDCEIDLGAQILYMSINGIESVLALTNSTLTCGWLRFGYQGGASPGIQTVILKDTVVNVTKFVGTKLNAESSLLFDGATLVPKAAATDFMPNSAALPTPTIGAGGLTVSNAYDVTIAKGLAGVGGLVKKGDGALTLSGPNTFTGGIDVQEGTLALPPGASFPVATTLAMADGTALRLKASSEGFASTNIALVLNANTDGKVAIEIDTSSGILEPGRIYTLLASGFDAASMSRITIDPAYELALAEGGALTLTFSPKTHVWTGAGSDAKWSTAANWNIGDPILSYDSITFSIGGFSIYDCADGLRLGSITAGYGCHTVNVETASFANVPITVASGAEFALVNADGVTNPFSTVLGTNVIAGVLDLGGATQTISSKAGGNNTGSFCDGGEIRNGTVNLTDTAEQHWDNTTFTFGADSHVSCAARIYLQNNAHLKFDGGTYTNSYTGVNNNHVIGANSGVSTLEVSNGGRLIVTRPWFVGHTASGSLIGDGGVIDVGNNPLYLSNKNTAKSVLALTNFVLSCSAIQFAYDANYSTQTVVLKNSVVNLSNFIYKNKTSSSSILFDGARLVPKAAAANFMPSGLPSPTLGADGLVISNAFDVTAAVGMKGTGGLVKMGAGKLTLTGAQSFGGDVVVSNGTFAAASTFAGGLQAASGTAIDVADATFGGDIAIGDGVAFAATNGVNWATTRAVLVAKTTAGVSFPWRQDADGRHLFTKTLGGVTSLYYGKQAGTIVIFK
ncbi:MAG: autotransporter-associated beta strand repeat-containing protein [Kiritimatiellae bacterium]|nr:autotransporter-associated beta strand repeat-containing protein [Kiritimatiellia bacterium]